jgi:hypothetical protein
LKKGVEKPENEPDGSPLELGNKLSKEGLECDRANRMINAVGTMMVIRA